MALERKLQRSKGMRLFKKIKERFIKWLVTPCIVEPPDESMDTARSLGRAEKWYLKFKIKF